VNSRISSGRAALVALACGCNAIETSPTPPPVNACPEHPCSAYAQSGPLPVCAAGACVVTTSASDLVVLVALPDDSYFAPSLTFAIPFDHLYDAPRAPGCAPPTCATLPAVGVVQTAYLISAQLAMNTFPLDNPGLYTALPAQATYRLLWPQSAAATATSEAAELPVGAVQAKTIGASSVDPILEYPGPASGPTIAFQAYLQPGYYERVVLPTPPFDQYYAPEVRIVSVSQGTVAEADKLDSFDITQETTVGPTVPTFDISRADGLDGWSAFLRDGEGQILSPVVPLSGSPAHAVLPSNHVPPGVDALTNAQLILKPPPGQALPTGVFSPVGSVLPNVETFPRLPAPITVQGAVQSEDGTPIPADLVFEATAIADAAGQYNSSNFEFVSTVSAVTAPGATPMPYSTVLPQGQYRLSVRPRDGVSQVTVVPFVVDARSEPSVGRDVVVAPLRRLSGTALIADGRPLFGATIEADPVSCVDGTNDAACLPRQASTSTDDHGAFQLAVDPGQYLLRAKPAAGTRLPWVSEPLSVTASPTETPVAALWVPAPASASLMLVDPSGRPVADAIVRVFLTAASGGAPLELGQAITAADGTYEMFLPPDAQ